MPRPDVLLGEKGRVGMLRGFESMGRLLSVTLGPIGGQILNEQGMKREPEFINDAATVARRIIEIPGGAENAGAMLMRHIAWRVREEVGDGSATTAVLARALAREVQTVAAAGANVMLVKRGVERGTEAAIRALHAMSLPLEGEQRIAAVATAATGNREIGKLLGEMYDVLGPNANVVIEPYVATFHDRAYHEGARFRAEIVSPYLVTDTVRRRAVLDDVAIIVADVSFDTLPQIQNALNLAIKADAKSLFMCCKFVSDKAIGVMVTNNERGSLKSCAANLKPVGDLRRGTFENIATLVGAKYLTDASGMPVEDLGPQDIGRAERVIVTKDTFTIIGGKGDKKAIRERQQRLQQRLREITDAEERSNQRDLLKHFSAGVGELRIGALTERERSALNDTAEQSMKAVAAAMESGIVPGGGAAFVACIPAVEALLSQADGDEAIGIRILARALEEPMRCIASNAGLSASTIVADVRRIGPGYGFDVRRKQVVNMLAEGIMDPTLIAKRALQHASSGAMMLSTTDALVLHRKPKEEFSP